MGDNNLGRVIVIIIIIIIILCILFWWINSSEKGKLSFNKRHDQNKAKNGDTRNHESRSRRRSGGDFTTYNQNGNTRFETCRSFKLNKSDKYKVVLPKNKDKEHSYTVAVKFDFSEHKISIQTPTSTPDGRMTDGYVAEIRHHIFEDSMLYDTLNDPVIQPTEINRLTESRATKISIKKGKDNNLMIEFDISPGVIAIGSMTVRIDSLTPSRQICKDFAIKNKSDYN
uniref:Uncharacterized protein n=1 Tax=Pithovirus LCPAC201 TaxID=2506591 RepID=A0A481Z6M0_9VIRU|nr:MAG: hypothetical protein LCPAC201_00410 [Pithovirus LCPAC201]